MFKEPLEKRFWKHVDKKGENECWNWVGAKSGGRKGVYGCINVGHNGQRPVNDYAHRVSYEMSVGKIPEGMFVCHICDNPICVNPKHLFLGTAQDNTNDMIQKGRNRKGYHTTEERLSRIVLEEMLSDFINAKVSLRKLGIKYGCNKDTISRMCHRHLGNMDRRRMKLSKDNILLIIEQWNSGTKKQCQLAKEFGVDRSAISRIVNGKYFCR